MRIANTSPGYLCNGREISIEVGIPELVGTQSRIGRNSRDRGAVMTQFFLAPSGFTSRLCVKNIDNFPQGAGKQHGRNLCLELPSSSEGRGLVATARPSPSGLTKSRRSVATPSSK